LALDHVHADKYGRRCKNAALARETIDTGGVNLLRQWIESLPGRPVLTPPKINPNGGRSMYRRRFR